MRTLVSRFGVDRLAVVVEETAPSGAHVARDVLGAGRLATRKLATERELSRVAAKVRLVGALEDVEDVHARLLGEERAIHDAGIACCHPPRRRSARGLLVVNGSRPPRKTSRSGREP
jgi:hypothetical protein